MDYYIHHSLKNYINIESERLSSYIVHYAIQSLPDEVFDHLLIVKRDSNYKIEKISYDASRINHIKKQLTDIIQQEYSDVESGNFDSYSFMQQLLSKNKFSHFSNGYMCEINMNAIRGSFLFGNIGPTIPIKLSFLGYVYVDVQLDVREYGINNMIAELDLVVQLSNLVSMPVSSRVHKVKIKQPLSIEIINGEIPYYYVDSYKKS